VQDQPQDHGVGHQGAGLDGRLGVDAQGRAVLDVGAEQVARGDGRELGEFLEETLGLRALADTWSASAMDSATSIEGADAGVARGRGECIPGAPTRMMRAALESRI